MARNRQAIYSKIDSLATKTTHSQVYRETILTLLREAVPFDGVCFTTVDPNTLLSTGAVTDDGIESIHAQLFEYEYVRGDFNSFDQLSRSQDPIATLSGATGGQLERSSKYRNVLLPAGYHDELKAAMLWNGACWGFLTLFRKVNSPLFQEDERQFVASLIPSIARHLRKLALAIPEQEVAWLEQEPGILILTDHLSRSSSNLQADHWLSLFRTWEGIDDNTIPRPIRAVCSRALAEMDKNIELKSSAKTCIRIPEGPYLMIRATVLQGSVATKQFAVWIELAKPSDIFPMISEAYGLSEREKQVLERIVRGFSTKEIAETMYISAYTVQDHLKSIFLKTGVTSRRELTWQLYSRFSVHLDDLNMNV
ncbi:helix-turn-helix transcriptional regulator [Paenibacillus selenitireducens]|uniref:Helix-turn-helix transcriptional regulator n=1 Tax=Paenibacillus selenitireducens TaxID=1324314 RepID=A0A1T2X5U9_9BACL|nr:helix-turn-helix transcriptional regulator [Paenibacillus selenitireducens]OPA75259.1 helix-turn-helix transcriptional regulator [Paenibacillus selenitireducens]